MSKDFGLDVSSKQIYLPKITADFARYTDGILQKWFLQPKNSCTF